MMGKPVRFAIALFSSTASAVEQPVDVDVAIEACCMLPERFGGVNRQEKRNPVGPIHPNGMQPRYRRQLLVLRTGIFTDL